MASSQVSRIEQIKDQFGTFRRFVVAWQTMDLVTTLDALGAFLKAADLLLEEVAALRDDVSAQDARLKRVEADRVVGS